MRRPMTREELELIFERGYNVQSRQELAQAWGVEELDARTADLVEDAMEEEGRALDLIESRAGAERLALDMVVILGGRARGEQIRKELLLRGQGDCSEAIASLIASHALIIVAPSSHGELDVEDIIATQQFLAHELALGAAVCRELDGAQDMTGKLAAWESEVRAEEVELQQSLELNLLHLMARLSSYPLKLNKSGVPNRRVAGKLIEGLVQPAKSHLPEPWLELDPPGQDYLAFLLAMSAQLGFTELRDDTVWMRADHVRPFFELSRREREHQLLDAIQKVRGWNEWVSSQSYATGLSEDIVELQLSQFVENGADLIGARGYLISVIRRARMSGWVKLEAFVMLCKQLDRDYLPRIVERFSQQEATEDEVERYVRAFIEHALFWTGFVKLALGDDGERLMALSARGEEVFGHSATEEQEDVHEPRAQKGSLVVQPNYEIMVFLDAVTTPTLSFLYEIAERIALANRVATFKLDASSLQRGYSQGLDADTVVDTLNASSIAPLADSVSFQIKDWERVWSRLVLFARGVLLRHEDPDRLDDVVGEIRYARRDAPVQMERIAAGSVFIAGELDEALMKALARHQELIIDYLGDLPPSLEPVGPLAFGFEPLLCDIVTQRELERMGELDRKASSPRRRVYRLTRARLEARFPRDTIKRAVTFLDSSVSGGCPPDQVLRLRHLFGLEDRIEVRHNLVMFELDEGLADLIMSSDMVDDLFIKRYSDTAIAVDAEQAEDLLEKLQEIGVVIDE